MQVKELMTNHLESVGSDAPLDEALRDLQQQHGSTLPVLENGKLVGTITDHDVVAWEFRAGKAPAAVSVRDVMHRDTPTIYDDQDARDAVRLMQAKKLSHVLVLTRDRQPVGTLALADALAAAGAVGAPAEAPPARIFLQPIAAPSILGLFGFAGATFIVATNMAGWYGNSDSPQYLFPFAAFFGGLAQFLAGMWAYKARDGLATAMHGTWGAFWMAYGLLFLLIATGTVPKPSGGFPELGYWFLVLAAITWAGTLAALAENITLTGVLATLAAGSTLACIGFLIDASVLTKIAGWVFMASAVIAWYLASAMMLEGSYRKVVLPIGAYKRAANTPGSTITHPVEYAQGEPGVKVGQ